MFQMIFLTTLHTTCRMKKRRLKESLRRSKRNLGMIFIMFFGWNFIPHPPRRSRWKYVVRRSIDLECEVSEEVMHCTEILTYIKGADLMIIVANIGPYHVHLV